MDIGDIKINARIEGLDASGPVRIRSLDWIGQTALDLVFERPDGSTDQRILYAEEAQNLSPMARGQAWSFDGDGAKLRLAIEATRIRLAHHFDPFLAINTSQIEPLPHQITAVYEAMLPRQPLRFLLADDPGAGKTIMAGLLIKELIARGELERCLIVAPGSLVEQWQDELYEKFGLDFSILSRDMLENSRSGNPFGEHKFLIARLDVLSRSDPLQEKLEAAEEWDLIICDEAHRMSASYFGGEVKTTKRYRLGQRLGQLCRHFLLMSATPHNGKAADFELFMALLDGDRFEGKFREGVHLSDAADLMRRLTKEELLKFDGTPLFPERRAYTATYQLSAAEAALYHAVTAYVREEMNRVQRFAEQDGQRRLNVGFALQILQRRLASSPAAIYHSLQRRKARLEKDLAEAKLGVQGQNEPPSAKVVNPLWDEFQNLDDPDTQEWEQLEDSLASGATSADSLEQLALEIQTLAGLEDQALALYHSGEDTKWQQLSRILDDPLMIDAEGHRRKLIVFTEAKDTLEYLAKKIGDRLGRKGAVEMIHGGVTRDVRRAIVGRFMQDRDLHVLVANDAAGEGVNLQRGHLMVNYDLPWNPNKIEQRFGRIHRIGQTQVCHLWNLVAANTREGDVYARLLEKIDIIKAALGGQVFDVLGDLFDGKPLRDLLWEAVQYGDQPEVKERLRTKIDTINVEKLRALLAAKKLTQDLLATEGVAEIRQQMLRAAAVRLQPHHIQGFFLEAFRALGGDVKAREPGRFELHHVPARIRERDRQIGTRNAVKKRYQRISFDKALIHDQPVAEFICPGHPLLEATLSLILEYYGPLLRQGALLVDETDEGEELRAIFLLEHAIKDGRPRQAGGAGHQVVSQRLQFVAIDGAGQVRNAGLAPHLDLRALTENELVQIRDQAETDWLHQDLEPQVKAFATLHLAQAHLQEVKARRLPEIDKTEAEVQARLKKEINYWDSRAAEWKAQARAGKATRLNWQNAQRRAEDLAARLQRRLGILAQERSLSAATPRIRGGLVVVPQGLLRRLQRAGGASQQPLFGFSDKAESRKAIELKAMAAVMAAERALGNQPVDVAADKVGYDIRSFDPQTQKQRFIEVKGRIAGARDVMVTRNEILTCLNAPDDYYLALVEVTAGFAAAPQYVRRPFNVEPAFDVTAQAFDLAALYARAQVPAQ